MPHIKKRFNTNFLKLFHKIKEEEIFLNSFNKANIAMIPKIDKNTTKKRLQDNTPDVNRGKNSQQNISKANLTTH